MAITPEMILSCRYEVGDTSVELPILADSEYTYFLEKNSENIRRSSLDAAKTILLKLSLNSKDSVVDVLSIKTSQQADQFRKALQLYIKSPELNGMYSTVTAWAGGVSKSDMQANIDNTDNNSVLPPASVLGSPSQADPTSSVSNPFLI